MSRHPLEQPLLDHLAGWGLRPFTSQAGYFQRQREVLSPTQLDELHRLLEAKRASAGDADETAFYDYTARPEVFPVLHSERYHYYVAVGLAVADRLSGFPRVLDFGCGPGILTTFYAQQFPTCEVVGVDRSAACIEAATQRAAALGLRNITFHCLDATQRELPGRYDAIVSCQALLQSENDPGVPSSSWRTFDRPDDPRLQSAFARRTGIAVRLDRLAAALAPAGRLLLFEKTQHLARRIPFQRHLQSLGFRPTEPPRPISYRMVEDMIEDGPLYVLERPSGTEPFDPKPGWGNAPFLAPQQELYGCRGPAARPTWERLPAKNAAGVREWTVSDGRVHLEWGSAATVLTYLYLAGPGETSRLIVGGPGAKGFLEGLSAAAGAPPDADPGPADALLQQAWPPSILEEDPAHTPLFELHTCAAQRVWAGLPEPRVEQQVTDEGTGGRQLHIEIGTAVGLVYLYCANTFDQRQLVLVEPERRRLLEDYYQELVRGHREQRS